MTDRYSTLVPEGPTLIREDFRYGSWRLVLLDPKDGDTVLLTPGEAVALRDRLNEILGRGGCDG